MNTILVTGGSGMLGRYVVHELKHTYPVSVLDTLKPGAGVDFRKCDVLDLNAVLRETEGVDAIIHLAAIPHPLNDPPEAVVRLNVMGTFHMLEAAARNGIPKFVLASSESTLGFAFMERRMYPDYFPIDEEHPARPQDPYGMSKLLCEQMCATYTRRYGMQTLCLRMPWIWVPEPDEQKLYRQLIDEYGSWFKNLWAFIHVMDAAAAFRLALERPYGEEHNCWFIVADSNWTGIPSVRLIREFFPESAVRADALVGDASLISNKKAKHDLKFNPTRTVDNVFRKEPGP